MRSILAVQCAPSWLASVGPSLGRDGFALDVLRDAQHAVAAVRGRPYALVLLDLLHDPRRGAAACAAIRHASDVPLVALSAHLTGAATVAALGAGADDALRLPISPGELRARIAAVLRRADLDRTHRPLRVGGIALDLAARCLIVGATPVPTRPKEFALLVALARRAGSTVSRAHLLHEVWGHDVALHTRTVDTHVSSLRTKLDGTDVSIAPVWGVGYRLVVAETGV